MPSLFFGHRFPLGKRPLLTHLKKFITHFLFLLQFLTHYLLTHNEFQLLFSTIFKHMLKTKLAFLQKKSYRNCKTLHFSCFFGIVWPNFARNNFATKIQFRHQYILLTHKLLTHILPVLACNLLIFGGGEIVPEITLCVVFFVFFTILPPPLLIKMSKLFYSYTILLRLLI